MGAYYYYYYQRVLLCLYPCKLHNDQDGHGNACEALGDDIKCPQPLIVLPHQSSFIKQIALLSLYFALINSLSPFSLTTHNPFPNKDQSRPQKEQKKAIVLLDHDGQESPYSQLSVTLDDDRRNQIGRRSRLSRRRRRRRGRGDQQHAHRGDAAASAPDRPLHRGACGDASQLADQRLWLRFLLPPWSFQVCL